jgi:hypothetical protein
MLLQPVLEEVAHRVCCGLFKEYQDEWQQLQEPHRRKHINMDAMSPYFLERSQVQTPPPPPPPPSHSRCRWRR